MVIIFHNITSFTNGKTMEQMMINRLTQWISGGFPASAWHGSVDCGFRPPGPEFAELLVSYFGRRPFLVRSC